MIDHFGVVENAVIKLVGDHLENGDKYFKNKDKQIMKSDDSVLGDGYKYFLITYPGEFPTVPMGTGVIETAWMVPTEIFVRFSNYTKTWAEFKAFRSDVFNLFNVRMIGRTLNRTPGVRDVLLSSEEKPTAYGENDGEGDPVFFSQRLQLSVFYKINRI